MKADAELKKEVMSIFKSSVLASPTSSEKQASLSQVSLAEDTVADGLRSLFPFLPPLPRVPPNLTLAKFILSIGENFLC